MVVNHLTAGYHWIILSGNLIQIPGIPQETCRNVQRLVQRGELDWARPLKVNIHLDHPLKQGYFGISGAISLEMLMKIHEQLTTFASIVQKEMWNQGTSDRFYPPDARHREHFIMPTGSVSIISKLLLQPLSSRLPSFYNRHYPRTKWYTYRHQTAGCKPHVQHGWMPFLRNRGRLQWIRGARYTQSKRVHTLFPRANCIRDYRVRGQSRLSQSSY